MMEIACGILWVGSHYRIFYYCHTFWGDGGDPIKDSPNNPCQAHTPHESSKNSSVRPDVQAASNQANGNKNGSSTHHWHAYTRQIWRTLRDTNFLNGWYSILAVMLAANKNKVRNSKTAKPILNSWHFIWQILLAANESRRATSRSSAPENNKPKNKMITSR